MYRILTGICCLLWCILIAFQTAARLQPSADMFSAAQMFSEDMASDIKISVNLSGSCEKKINEYNTQVFLENTAALLGINSRYGVYEKKAADNKVYELSGADEGRSYCLKYMNNSQNEGFVSWEIVLCSDKADTKNAQRYYKIMNSLREKYGIDSLVCLKISGTADGEMTDKEAQKLFTKIDSSIVYSAKEDNLQMYYGYGEKLGSRYVLCDGKKANVNIMYRTDAGYTRCFLGFPVVYADE